MMVFIVWEVVVLLIRFLYHLHETRHHTSAPVETTCRKSRGNQWLKIIVLKLQKTSVSEVHHIWIPPFLFLTTQISLLKLQSRPSLLAVLSFHQLPSCSNFWQYCRLLLLNSFKWMVASIFASIKTALLCDDYVSFFCMQLALMS